MNDITFNVQVHFSNGVSLERSVSLGKAYKLATKENVIIPEDTEFVEIKGINNSIIIPLNMIFVVNVSPDFKHLDRISRYMLYRRDGGRCAYCGKKLSIRESTKDHIIPRSKGGKDEWENLALSCFRCNTVKNNRTPEQAGMKLNITPYNPKKKR